MNEFKSGFVGILGMPNVGKSTLYNALMEDKQAQTTRHRILGIKSLPNAQMVFSDTPGMLKKISYAMHKQMMKFVNESLEDSDVLVLVLDATQETPSEEFLNKFSESVAKKIIVLNKIDLLDQENLEKKLLLIKEQLNADIYLPISAKEKFQIDVLEKEILSLLPFHPPYFSDDQITDRSERFFVNEMVRAEILNYYREEIPYSIEVQTIQFKESEEIIRLMCEIICERESQKGIIIGPKGSALKVIGTKARKEIEAFFNKKVYIELFVKVRENWRDNKNMLRQFGYEPD